LSQIDILAEHAHAVKPLTCSGQFSWFAVYATANNNTASTWDGHGFLGRYKVAGSLDREHQGRVSRFVKILSKGIPKDY
jgi:hypothetical protein